MIYRILILTIFFMIFLSNQSAGYKKKVITAKILMISPSFEHEDLYKISIKGRTITTWRESNIYVEIDPKVPKESPLAIFSRRNDGNPNCYRPITLVFNNVKEAQKNLDRSKQFENAGVVAISKSESGCFISIAQIEILN